VQREASLALQAAAVAHRQYCLRSCSIRAFVCSKRWSYSVSHGQRVAQLWEQQHWQKHWQQQQQVGSRLGPGCPRSMHASVREGVLFYDAGTT
jgi:hypothetical protein